ncbi:polypeptide N-acetylgalactosaminyltransferase 5-like isoform X1 [Mya arenaria]|uniref:polypeptide N-acetylgalactosaminyltransferase 5-like isoform X1 n=1 Tax=Mya arenaria TaxID=6604 RepID=UPI0022DF3B0C|nr:polypeptide N-acetylgalactosaminyltransferase 5-like isoform X1 [Mya arenaria]XP_052809801.1 polypeptide N-acetylgalactosaminyltransferase 5-like isoform X1 [Mya arenaria]
MFPRQLRRLGIRLCVIVGLFWLGTVFLGLKNTMDLKDKEEVYEMFRAGKGVNDKPLDHVNINNDNQIDLNVNNVNEKQDKMVHRNAKIDNNIESRKRVSAININVQKANENSVEKQTVLKPIEQNPIEENQNAAKDVPDKRQPNEPDKVANEANVAQIGAPVNRADKDRPLDAPGEMGKPVYIDKEKLTKEQLADFDKGWLDNAFNRYASDMISLHRALPDIRDEACKTIDYGENLPCTCVIIIFHNEAWSVLLRTIHSVIDRSEPNLLKEIIVVDDFSDFDHLKDPLQEYIDKLDKVTLVRATERSGLIRARLMGFDKCTAEVAIFLDSHCEATEGWLPPLLARINENETNVLVPAIDVIDQDTFSYGYRQNQDAKDMFVGGFDWGLLFNWHQVPELELKRIGYKTYVPVRTPTMAGGLFAISSKFFTKLGTYDSGFDIWGGENLELSFKTWMCGGTLETIPCSHVGHVFRKRSPYKWDSKRNVLKRNLVRLAEVWLDEFKEYFYQRIGGDLGEYGDVSDRKALREKLQCKSFKWYLNNIYPELFIPGEAVASGEIRNYDRSMCVDAPTEPGNAAGKISMYPCHGQGGNQFWLISKEDEIRRDESCWDATDGTLLKVIQCHSQKGHQLFLYREDDTIYNPAYDKCLEMSWDAQSVNMAPCVASSRQKWKMQRKKPDLPGRA